MAGKRETTCSAVRYRAQGGWSGDLLVLLNLCSEKLHFYPLS